MLRSQNPVIGFHAHVYFELHQTQAVNELCARAAAAFDVRVGHLHSRPIGPHPMPSCQISCSPELFGALLPWLIANRQGLTVFCHAMTGNGLRDHTENAFWLGNSQSIDLTQFTRDPTHA